MGKNSLGLAEIEGEYHRLPEPFQRFTLALHTLFILYLLLILILQLWGVTRY